MEDKMSFLTQRQSKLIEDYNLSNLSERDLLLVVVGAVNSIDEKQEGYRNELIDQKEYIKKVDKRVEKLSLKIWKSTVIAGACLLGISVAIPDISDRLKPLLSSLIPGV